MCVSVCVCVCVHIKVTFVNEKTGEYQFYEVSFRSIKPSALAVISLTTTVRRRKQHPISIDNPLPTPATLTCSSTSADVIVPPHFIVQPESTVSPPTPTALLLNVFNTGG